MMSKQTSFCRCWGAGWGGYFLSGTDFSTSSDEIKLGPFLKQGVISGQVSPWYPFSYACFNCSPSSLIFSVSLTSLLISCLQFLCLGDLALYFIAVFTSVHFDSVVYTSPLRFIFHSIHLLLDLSLLNLLGQRLYQGKKKMWGMQLLSCDRNLKKIIVSPFLVFYSAETVSVKK